MPSAFLLINCKLGFDRQVINRLREIPVVIQVYRVWGAYDIIVTVAADTVQTLRDFLRSDLKRIDSIISTVTLITKDV